MGSAAPSSMPSGTTPVTGAPKGDVSTGAVVTQGSPDGAKRVAMQSSKNKRTMSNGKMKTKM
jgi:hypothetical protein